MGQSRLIGDDVIYTTAVRITKSRWSVKFELELDEEELKVLTFIASADSWFTEGDGIWFGTEEEWDEHGY